MVKRSSKRPRTDAQGSADEKSRCLVVARKGIKTSADFKSYMSGLMSDLIEGKVAPQVGNAACNAGGKLLKIVEMEYRHGAPKTANSSRRLQLAENGA